MTSSKAPSELHPEVQRFQDRYDFPLDPFQLEASNAIAAGRGVLVAAPTGAGKTVVGEFAVFTAFHNQGTCFYTTPIKALSNQKFHDLTDQYGEDNVGLLTGDVTINGDAPIVVMTTEVLRNMIYQGSDRLRTLTHVVMDEVHFLADKSRGPVWEEAILNLDPSVILVSLSATVSNVEEFGGWLSTVRGHTDIVLTEHRPIPLSQFMMVGRQIMPLFQSEQSRQPSAAMNQGTAVNRAVVAAAAKAEESGKRRGPKRSDVALHLDAANMLPAIYFIFSRVGCDAAVKQLLADKVEFTTAAQRAEILDTIDEGVKGLTQEDLNVLGFRQWRRAVSRGFAAHHAGMLPAFRHIIEDLFERGLLKVCFATETLALGINMPARSVVLEKLIKFNGEAHVDLTPGQYTQLTGRAGRRGIDTKGNAVVLWAQGIDPHAVADLASTRTYPLDSTFRPGYNMAVNLINTKGLEESHRLLQRSFAQYQADGTIVEAAEAVERRRRQLAEAEKALRDVISDFRRKAARFEEDLDADTSTVVDYARLRRELSQEERRAKRDAGMERNKETAKLLANLTVGDVLALPTGRNPMTAVVARSDHRHHNPNPTIITEDGWVERVSAETFGNTPIHIGHMKLHKGVERAPKRLARSVAANLRRMHFDKPAKLKAKARGGSAHATELRQRVHSHPVHAWEGREEMNRAAELYIKAQRRLAFEQEEATPDRESLSSQFNRILSLLEEMDYVELTRGEAGPDITDATITLEGERLARVHHESDLLIAQCLRRGVWDNLDPAELAAVASTCVFENRKETSGDAALPTDDLEDAVRHTLRIYNELASDEQRHNLPLTRQPELGFATAVHQWTAGAPLEYCLQAAEAAGAILTPGDFVRWCRRVIDLLDQIRQTGYSAEVKSASRKAVAAMQRGVVALEV